MATADLFPRFTLGGLIGTQAFDSDALFERDSETRLVALGVDWSFLDVGRVRARIAATDAAASGALAQYEQTVLLALEETENALVRFGHARAEDAHLEQAAVDSARAAALARVRFDAGADADLANAVSGCVWGGFANAGQTCSGIERTYVVREVADRFLEGVAREAGRLTVGDPTEWDTEIGPMVSEDQYGIVTSLIDDAVAGGAELITGGPREVAGFPGKFIAPTVLAGVTGEMRIMREEIFGPAVPIVVVDSEEEALERANDSNFGLGASIWTRDRAKGERMARQVESGMVWINDHSYTHAACQCSWGGVKESGIGRSHSKFGFYECVNVKLVAWEPGLTRDFWWQPYDRTLGQAVRASAQLLYGRNGQRLRALREGGIPLLRVGARTMRKGR